MLSFKIYLIAFVAAATHAAPTPFLTPANFFKFLDANNDGILTSDEWLAFKGDQGIYGHGVSAEQDKLAVEEDFRQG